MAGGEARLSGAVAPHHPDRLGSDEGDPPPVARHGRSGVALLASLDGLSAIRRGDVRGDRRARIRSHRSASVQACARCRPPSSSRRRPVTNARPTLRILKVTLPGGAACMCASASATTPRRNLGILVRETRPGVRPCAPALRHARPAASVRCVHAELASGSALPWPGPVHDHACRRSDASGRTSAAGCSARSAASTERSGWRRAAECGASLHIAARCTRQRKGRLAPPLFFSPRGSTYTRGPVGVCEIPSTISPTAFSLCAMATSACAKNSDELVVLVDDGKAAHLMSSPLASTRPEIIVCTNRDGIVSRDFAYWHALRVLLRCDASTTMLDLSSPVWLFAVVHQAVTPRPRSPSARRLRDARLSGRAAGASVMCW